MKSISKSIKFITLISVILLLIGNVIWAGEATQQYVKPVKIFGVRADIAFTNPNLNGGQFSLHQLTLFDPQVSQTATASMGWRKLNTTTMQGILSYTDVAYNTQIVTFTTSQATHKY